MAKPLKSRRTVSDPTRSQKSRRSSLARRAASRALSATCQKCYGLRLMATERYEPLYRLNVRVMVPCDCTKPKREPDFKAMAAGDTL